MSSLSSDKQPKPMPKTPSQDQSMPEKAEPGASLQRRQQANTEKTDAAQSTPDTKQH